MCYFIPFLGGSGCGACCFVCLLQRAKRTLICRHSTFGLIFAACAAHITHTQRASGKRKHQIVAYHWAPRALSLALTSANTNTNTHTNTHIPNLLLPHPFCALPFNVVIRCVAARALTLWHCLRSFSRSPSLSHAGFVLYLLSKKQNAKMSKERKK